MKKIDILAIVLLILGGINWGVFGVFNFNVVDYVFGKDWISQVIYFFIGISAIYVIVSFKTRFSKLLK